jgi:hypothetical protein
MIRGIWKDQKYLFLVLLATAGGGIVCSTIKGLYESCKSVHIEIKDIWLKQVLQENCLSEDNINKIVSFEQNEEQ